MLNADRARNIGCWILKDCTAFSSVKRIILNIGDVVVSNEPAVLETVLGSCVSLCLWDEQSKTGGMNHFMLPELTEGLKDTYCCGSESIARLINKLRSLGTDIRMVKAKLFGGGRVIRELGNSFDIGEKNIKAAKDILMEYDIPIVKEFTGPDYGIKVVFYTATGKAFVKKI
ncbi:MAG: chemotaxis protein CheD [Nitrospirae bacterium]|nr:chemotaxis protein CheD [Nitrospirota bacterium]